MRRIGLRDVLVVSTVGLVGLAVLLVGTEAVRLLKRLANEQGRARVDLAGRVALERIEASGHELERATKLLAERPTLERLLSEGNEPGLRVFLERFAATSAFGGCAVEVDGRVVTGTSARLPWATLAPLLEGPAGYRLLRTSEDEGLLLAAATGIASRPGTRVLAARRLDEAFAAALSGQVGLPLRILGRDEALDAYEDPRRPIFRRVLELAAAAGGRIKDAGLFVSVHPLRGSDGEVVGLVEVSLEAAAVDASVRHLGRVLLFSALAVAALAGLVALLLARRLVLPIESLERAAARIGRGDLASPVPPATGKEAASLATTLEEMRSRLLQLTAELTRRRAEAEAVLVGIVEGVFSVDRNRRIVYMNPQVANLLGISAEDASGRFCGDVLNPVGALGVRPCEENCPILHARFRGGARATERLQLASGQRRTVVITSSPAVPEDVPGAGDGRQFQVVRDETETEASRRLRDTVVANVSHEFRTPLSAQLASIEILRDRLPELAPQEVRGLILSIERGTLRLTRLVDNLLESLRIEAGQDSIRKRPVALDEVIEEAVLLTSPLIEQRQQRLEVQLPYPMPTLQGDAQRLTQVFVNLLANANKFAPAGSLISVGGEVSEGHVHLWVDDEGPGFPHGAGDRIFDRFMRSPGDEPEESGMGLGLWIVKSIVERHGGHVSAEASGPGTRFRVTLPR